MGRTTKIDWADATWNPVTGCLHGCEYCYARRIAERFGGFDGEGKLHDYVIPQKIKRRDDDGNFGEWHNCPYPFGFDPTFHIYKLDDPKKWKKPKTIFVCSMADLFGEWVPDVWIQAVFNACKAAPQHRYIFLTKNPKRYIELNRKGMLPQEHWYGYSATHESELWEFQHADECPCMNLFVSIEPIQSRIVPSFSTHCPADWVIIGAETGNRREKVVPEKGWIEEIADACGYAGRPVFMKESLRELMGNDFKQEFPWTKTW